MRRKRDSQRGKVYASEEAWQRGKPWRKEFPTKWEAEDFIRGVWTWCAAVRGRVPFVPAAPPRVIIRSGVKKGRIMRSFANPYRNTIKLGELNSYAALHEMAHICCPPDERHGPLFVKAYLTLVKEFMGLEAALSLSSHFDQRRVRCRPKQKRAPLSPERRAQLREQLARARASRQVAKCPTAA